ncbi:MAG: sulfatase-like hydrolase/transferase [Planctomycetota bacterium]
MIRNTLIALIAIIVWAACDSAMAERPNVILVMCDDLGYGDLSCFRPDTPIETPNLTLMCEAGLKFNRFYAAAPVCSPTRGSCLTGRHPYRYGIYSANVGHLPKDEITLPELLKQQGYRTGHFGKWHLGTLTQTVRDSNRGGPKGAPHFSPPRWHGYDDSFVTEAKVPTYDPMIKPLKAPRTAWDSLGGNDERESFGTRYWNHAGEVVTENTQGDDSRIIMDRAIPFIEASVSSEQPFFAAIWFHAPHLPVVASEKHRERYQDSNVYERNYYGCVTALDDQMGRLRESLEKLGVSDNTMLWFCSDNGPEGSANKAPGSAGELRGRKRSLYEGGVRVPGILVWPEKIKGGRQTDFPAVTSDYLPTVLDAIGIDIPNEVELDGQSLMDVIDGQSITRTKPIGFRSAKQIAWHQGDEKVYSGDSGKTWELYNLKADPGETNDLADSKPDRMKELVRDAKQWSSGLKK